MYKSTIEIFMKQIRMKQDETIVRAVQDVGIFVDKDELIKALQYDRGQYDKGYADGQKDAKEAQNIDPESLRPQGKWIPYHEADFGWDEYGRYCSRCKWKVEDDDIRFSMAYCPKCGARMKGAGDDAAD